MTSALVTDFYELTMMQGYFLKKHNPRVVFDVFYRNNPFSGGYTLFTGIEEVISRLEEFRFSDNAGLKDLWGTNITFYEFGGDHYTRWAIPASCLNRRT